MTENYVDYYLPSDAEDSSSEDELGSVSEGGSEIDSEADSEGSVVDVSIDDIWWMKAYCISEVVAGTQGVLMFKLYAGCEDNVKGV